jgi:hypothetical protein
MYNSKINHFVLQDCEKGPPVMLLGPGMLLSIIACLPSNNKQKSCTLLCEKGCWAGGLIKEIVLQDWLSDGFFIQCLNG